MNYEKMTKAELISEIKSLKSSERRFRAIFEQAAVGVAQIETKTGQFVRINKRYCDIAGYTQEEMTSTTFMKITHTDDLQADLNNMKKLKDGKIREFSMEKRYYRKDGSIVWVYLTVSPMWDVGEQPDYHIAVVEDITERKQTEENLHEKNSYLKLLQVAAVAANEAIEIKDAFQPVLEEICRYTGWEIGHVYVISKDDHSLLEPTDIWRLKDKIRFRDFCSVTDKTRFARGIGLPGRVLASGQPHWIVDVTKDKNFLRTKIAKAVNIKSGVAFPVMVGHKVVAVMTFFTTEEIKPDKQFMNIMAGVGTQLGRAVERKQAEEDLLKNKETLDHAQKIANLGSWESDIVKNKTIWSDEAYRQFSLIPQEFAGKNESFLDFVHPDDKESVKKAIKEALYKRRPYDIDFRIVLKDGTERILHSEAEVVFEDNGKPQKMIGTSLDVTERKQVDKAIQTLVKSIVGKTGQEFFDKIVVSMNEWLGTDCAFIGQITNGNNVKALSMQMDGKIIHDYGYTIGDGPCEVVVKDGCQVYKEKICELFPKNKVLSEIGAEGYVGTVLRDKNSRTIGIIWAVSRKKLDIPIRTSEVIDILAAKASSEIERKRMEEALYIANEEWERSFNALPDHICILDMSGAVMRANKTMRERFEPIHGDLKGLDYRLIYCGTATTDPQPPCAAVLSGSLSVSVETQLPTMDGWQMVSSFPLFNKAKKQIGAVSVVTDITDRKQMEETLFRVEKMKALGTMTAGVAHEFNNILAVISSNVELLEETNGSDKESKKILRTIYRATDDGTAIVDRMYEFTDTGKNKSQYISMDMNDLIKQVIDFTKPKWKEMAHAGGITYHIDKKCAGTLPAVQGSPSEMREVLLNIINNALEAMPGGGTLTIKTQSELKGDYVEISFVDTGKGMSEEVKQNIFDPFFTTRSPEGTGLGMSITYGIIARHDGMINIESKLGNGSTITICLPASVKAAKSAKRTRGRVY